MIQVMCIFFGTPGICAFFLMPSFFVCLFCLFFFGVPGWAQMVNFLSHLQLSYFEGQNCIVNLICWKKLFSFLHIILSHLLTYIHFLIVAAQCIFYFAFYFLPFNMISWKISWKCFPWFFKLLGLEVSIWVFIAQHGSNYVRPILPQKMVIKGD